MTYFTMVPVGAPHQIFAERIGWLERVPDPQRRAAISGIWMNGGSLLNAKEMPTALRLEREPKNMPDVFFSDGGVTVCSKAMRELIEQLDPGLHQFIPIEIIHKNGQIDNGGYFIFHVHRKLDTIDDSKTKATMASWTLPDNPKRHGHYLNWGLTKKEDVAVFKERLSKGNLWREKAYPRIYMMSDALFDAFKEHDMKFFKTQKALEV
jgi:hypothetical protein